MFIARAENYDERLLEGRVEAEAAVIGCVMKDLLLLGDYNIKESDFITKDGLFLFKILDTLNKKNTSEITEFDIMSINDSVYEKFEELGGMKLVNDMKERIEIANFTTYLDDLYKHNAIMKLTDNGFDLLKEIEFNGKKVVPIKLFKQFDSEQVKEFYEYIVNDINVLEVNKGIEECVIDITDELLESFYNGEEMGVPFDKCGLDVDGNEIYGFPTISNQTQGFLEGSLSILAGYSSVGKSTIMISMLMALIHRGEKVCIISNEQRSKVFTMNFIMFILTRRLKYYNLTKKKLRAGNVTNEDKAMLKKAQKIWREEYLGKIYFVSTPNTSMSLIEKKFREYHLRYGCTTGLYDTFKLDMNSETNDNHWISLIKDSRTLHELAMKYNMKMIATMQCAIATQGQLFLDASILSNSKAVKEILENLYLVRNVYPEEMDENNKKFYCNPYRLEKIGGKWIEKKVEFKKEHTYKMLFLDKVRSGENSESNNYAVILKFDGSHGMVSEYCLCRPKRGRIQ